MSDEANRTGQVSSTPEGGPIDEGTPVSEPGAGRVRSTPEAAPQGDDGVLVPPTWQEHMDGPIPGLDEAQFTPPAAAREPAMSGDAAPTQTADWKGVPTTSFSSSSAQADDEELRKWPPYSGKPVSAAGWDALRYAAPVISQAEKLVIKAIGLAGRGLSKLAQYLEARRVERQDEDRANPAGER
jgi:hypothetical protein